MRRSVAFLGGLASVWLASAQAFGSPNDLAINRLSMYNQAAPGAPPDYVFGGGCGTPASAYAQCEPDNQLFSNLVNELGGALAPPLLAPAGTMGYNGFYAGYEMTVTGISSSQEYWNRGTLGNPMTNANVDPMNPTSQRRASVPDQLYVSHLHVRKAFPFGFELGMQASYLHDSNIVAMGLDIRWALFEGFHTGVGYLPDFSVRGSVNTMVGQQQMYLTIVGVDAMISKQIAIGGVMTVTPYVGGQALFILGDSTVVDATPTRSAYAECTRRHTEFMTDPVTGQQSSSLICDSGVNTAPINDSRNEMVFLATRIVRPRAFAGLRLHYGLLTITGEFTDDVVAPMWLNGDSSVAGEGRPCTMAQPCADGTTTGRSAPTLVMQHQWQASFGVGFQF